jgi:hypothetical protein
MSTNLVSITTSTLLATALAYILAKIVAVTHGTAGLGLLGGVFGAIAFIGALGALGLAMALPVSLASSSDEGLPRKYFLIATSVLFLFVPLVVVVSAISGLLSRLADYPLTVSDYCWIGIATLATLEIQLVAAAVAVRIGAREAAWTSLFGTGAGALTSALLIGCMPGIALPLAIGIGGLVSLSACGVLTLRHRLLRKSESCIRSELQAAAYFGLSVRMWLASLGSNMAWGIYPILALGSLGAAGAGLLRAALSLSTLVLYIGTALVTYWVVPKIAPFIMDPITLYEHFRLIRNRVVLWQIFLAVGISVASPILLIILFSQDFVAAASLVAILSIAMVFRVLSLVNSSLLVAGQHTKVQALIEWLSAFILVASSLIAYATQAHAVWYAVAMGISSLAAFGVSEVLSRRFNYPSVLKAGRFRGCKN